MFKDDFDLNNIFVSGDENYKNVIGDNVVPYLSSIMKDGYIEGEKGVRLYYKKYLVDKSNAGIVICHGLVEYIERYDEIVYYLTQAGYNVYIMEHRGHGRSGRLGVKDKSEINVESFDYYVSDFKKFLDKVVIKENVNNKLFLFAHSMGGAIGSKILIDYPEYFNAAVLESPMMKINTGTPEIFAKILAYAANFFGFGDNFILGQGKFCKEELFEESGTSSLVRYKYMHEQENRNEDFQRGGPSYRWLKESLKVTRYITAKENASKVKVPVILFQAENDSYVKPEGQNKFSEFAKDCRLFKVSGAKHEIYREGDKILKEFMEQILEFYHKENNI